VLRRWQCCGSEEVEVVSGRDAENDDCVDSVVCLVAASQSVCGLLSSGEMAGESSVACDSVETVLCVCRRRAASFRCTEIAKGTVCKMTGISVLRVGTADFSPLDPHGRVRRVSTSQSAFTWINELVIPFILIKCSVLPGCSE
jgi:hypothetical protein